MEIIHQLKSQIRDQLRKSGFIRGMEELNANADNWAAVKASIVSGLYPQVARVNSSSGKLATRRDPSVRLHMTSALLGVKVEGSGGSQKKALTNLPSEWLVYQEMSR
jgi:ATP-dependent RNA helicase YTHDC2